MSAIIVLLEAKDSTKLRPASLHAIAFARQLAKQLNTSFSLALLGHQIELCAESARGFGASCVYAIDNPMFDEPLAERQVPTLRALVEHAGANYIVGAATSTGKDILPRLAQVLESAYISDCIGIDLDSQCILWKRPVCAGNAIAYCASETPRTVVAIRHSQFEAAQSNGCMSPIRSFQAVPSEPAAKRVEIMGHQIVENPRPELTEARVVVSGGRALAGRFFELLDPLADALGAALGATRAACDGGFAPSDFQVGQTGKVVSPDLYLAVGISGAIQHLAGMRGSKIIVAINSDPRAPIVSVADYAIVGDLFKLVPELVDALQQRASSS